MPAATARPAPIRSPEPLAVGDHDTVGRLQFALARSSPTHELSAHGRNVQRRLETPVAAPVNPSLWKRLRFAIYRLRTGR